ncbi:MAG TPA: hypothetical protein VD995_06450 [Azospirillum sp.]|nr:hypothetical protein [Azospirillum sp.]
MAPPTTRVQSRRGFLLALCGSLLLAPPARAQAPSGSYCYIFGRSADDDHAGLVKAPLPDGERDTELRLYLNNLHYYLGPSASHDIRWMRLRHRTLPGLRWDTVPGSRSPVLVVRWQGRTVNRGDGSIAGLNLPDRTFLQLFVADPGPVAARTQGFVLDVTTFDGTLTIPVAPFDRNDNQFY